jgi:hypothetical protein
MIRQGGKWPSSCMLKFVMLLKSNVLVLLSLLSLVMKQLVVIMVAG